MRAMGRHKLSPSSNGAEDGFLKHLLQALARAPSKEA